MHLDDLFRDNLKNREFEFDENAWLEAEKMLDNSKPAGVWYSSKAAIAVLVLIGMTAVTVPFLLTDSNEQLADQAIEQVSATNNTSETSNEASDTEAVSSELESSNSAKSAQSLNETESVATPNADPVSPKATSTTSNLPNTQSGSSANKTDVTGPSNNGTGEVLAATTTNNSDNNNAQATPSAIAAGGGNLNTGMSNHHRRVSDFNRSDYVSKKIDYIFTNEIMALWDIEPFAINHEPELQLNDVKLNNMMKRVSFGVLGGLNVEQGFLNNQATASGYAFGPIAGVSVSYLLGGMVSLDANLLYRSRNGLNSTMTGYDGNGNYFVQDVNRLHYLDIPFYLNYGSRRHGIYVGLQYSQLLFASAGRTTNVTNQSGESKIEETNEYSNDDSFAPNDMAMVFGYEMILAEQLNVGVRMNYGLFDITDDNTFKVSTRDQNVGLKLYLEYKLFNY